MTLKLCRTSREQSGVFGTLQSDDGTFSCVTLEHAYPVFDGFASKIPVGTYTCVKGIHRLEGITDSFETFEITSIPGHSDILYHWGNYNKDSSGCVLLGHAVQRADNADIYTKMITNSKDTFQKFMSNLQGVDSFILVVS